MTPKEFWTAAYLKSAARGLPPFDCHRHADLHLVNYINRWPETPTENTPATTKNLPVVDKTAVEPIQESDKFEWRNVSDFNEGDAVRDIAGKLVLFTLKYYINSGYTDVQEWATKYLARCKPTEPTAAADFVPTWEWAKRTDIPNQWDNDTHEDVTVHQEPRNPNAWYFYYRGDVPASPSYPTLQAAQLEAERYWKLYVNPARITTTETTTERRPT